MKKVLSMILILVLVISCTTCAISVGAAATGDTIRYTVLILDSSGSMSGTPHDVQKAAAIKFGQTLFDSTSKNYVAVVKINSSSSRVCDFTDSIDTFNTAVNNIGQSGGTNINQALHISRNLLGEVSSESDKSIIKNIVLCSDGLPESGSSTSSGPYSSFDSSEYYSYANAAYATATAIQNSGVNIYSLGFFHSLSGEDLTFGRRFMNDVENAGYYEVTDPEQLVFTFGEIADDVSSQVKEITFTYQSGQDYNATCYYSNAYFSQNSYYYNSHLATMSLSFAMSAFGSAAGGDKDYSNKSKNAKKLLEDIGFESDKIEVNSWFTKKPSTDSMAAIAGSMPINVNNTDYTLIAVALRGGGYEQEWAGNFLMGTDGEHQGFTLAKNEVLTFLEKYIYKHSITGKIKLWLTGYSRSAATANLVSGELHKSPSILGVGYDLKPEDIYTYCFETPAGALRTSDMDSSLYHNIFNIINSSDPVPYVAPSGLGFRRYGRDLHLPSAASDPENYGALRSNMLKIFRSLKSTSSYVVDNFKMKKIDFDWGFKINDDPNNPMTQGVFLSTFVSKLSTQNIKSRSNYVKTYQAGIREVLSLLNKGTSEQNDLMMTNLKNKFSNEWLVLVGSYLYNIYRGNLLGADDVVLRIIADWFKDAAKSAGLTFDSAAVNSAADKLGHLVLSLVLFDLNNTTSLAVNLDSIKQAHTPELCYSWLASMDSYYTAGAKSRLNNGGYRIIHINCPVNVKVTDASGKAVASITNDKPDTLSNTEYLYGVDENGQKYVVLPVDKNYSVTITGRQTDTVDYGIMEYSAATGGFVRNVNYFDVALPKNDSLYSTIPAFSDADINGGANDGSSAAYTLRTSSGKTLAATSDDSGDEINDTTYAITAVSDNIDQGVVVGSGVYIYGEFAQVEAYPADGYDFAGWYENNNLVSTDATYRFRVEKDVELVGKFKVGHKHTFVNGICTGCKEGIFLNKTSLSLKKGVSYPLKATVTYTKDDKTLTWKSSNPSVASVSATGIVTPNAPGSAVITASTPNGNKATCKVTVTLATPKITGIGNAVSGVKLTIGKVTGAAKYRVFRKVGSASWVKLTDTAALTYTDKTAKSGVKYTYTVRCVTKDGKRFTSDYNTTGKIITFISAPVITKLTNTASGTQFKWKKPAGAVKFRIFRKAGKGSWVKLKDTTALSYTDKSAKSGVKYSYTVRCITKNGKSFTSAFDAAGKSITYIATPKITGADNVAGGIRLTWKKPAGAVRFRIFRKVGSGAWKKLADTSALTYTDKTVKADTIYSYTVRCISKNGRTVTSGMDTKGKMIYRKADPRRLAPIERPVPPPPFR